MATNLAGKLVLVTGASAGIGKATVSALIDAGANVLATGRRRQELDGLLKKHGTEKVRIMAGDLNDGRFVTELAAAADDVEIMVNNAGILTYAPLMDMEFDDVEAMFRTNVLTSFRVMHAVAKSMIERRRGHLIVITSIAAREVYRLGVIYCATKHALSAIARGLRIELQGYGIRVSEIAPGMVDTNIRAASNHPMVVDALKNRKFAPLTAEQVAEAVVYTAKSDDECCADLVELRPRGSAQN